MGEYNSEAWLGGHNAALNAWQRLKINPDGGTELHLGNLSGGGAGVAPILNIQNTGGALVIREGSNLVLGTTTGTRIGTATTQRLGFWNATPVVQSTGWTTTNVTTDRSFDANATTIDELADVVTCIEYIKNVKNITELELADALERHSRRKGRFENRFYLVWSSDSTYATTEKAKTVVRLSIPNEGEQSEPPREDAVRVQSPKGAHARGEVAPNTTDSTDGMEAR
jgi:hypothetical protein